MTVNNNFSVFKMVNFIPRIRTQQHGNVSKHRPADANGELNITTKNFMVKVIFRMNN